MGQPYNLYETVISYRNDHEERPPLYTGPDSYVAFAKGVAFARSYCRAHGGWFFANLDGERVTLYEGLEPDWMPEMGLDDHLDGLTDREVTQVYDNLSDHKPLATIEIFIVSEPEKPVTPAGKSHDGTRTTQEEQTTERKPMYRVYLKEGDELTIQNASGYIGKDGKDVVLDGFEDIRDVRFYPKDDDFDYQVGIDEDGRYYARMPHVPEGYVYGAPSDDDRRRYGDNEDENDD